MLHQYIDRKTGDIKTERLFGDPIVQAVYSDLRETTPLLYQAAVSKRMSKLLGYVNYDFSLGTTLSGNRRFIKESGINFDECIDLPGRIKHTKKSF